MRFNASPEIIYQIMPDRFSRSRDREPDPAHFPPKAKLSSWNDPIDPEMHGRQFFGGCLKGIEERLPWLEELGATAIMLTPVFPAPSYHKYDATDFRAIDPALGSDRDFDELLDACHARGIKLIMDIAVNHLSARHPLFLKAKADPTSAERRLFRFAPDGEHYDCWWGYGGMPEINYDEPAARREFIEGPDSVIGFWVKRGIDGIRLDCANDLSPGVVSTIRQTARAIKPDIYVMGEIFSYPAEWLRCLDGVMNYSWQSAAGALFDGRITSRVFGAFLAHFAADAGVAGLSDSLSMLTSHDTPRMQDMFRDDVRRMEHALLLQFTLPGIPMIWAGEEMGMDGRGDHQNRKPIPWDQLPGDGTIRTRFDQLIALRRERAELHRGEFVELSALLPEGVVGFLRRVPRDPGAFCLVLINVSRERKAFTLFLPESHLYSTMTMADTFSGATAKFVVGAADIGMEPGDSRVYLPRPRDSYPNYSFYKNRGCAWSGS